MPSVGEPAGSVQSAFRTTQRKWSPVVTAAGWTTLPNVLIERQAELGLDPIDMNILVHIAARWWKPTEPPRISKVTIAKAMGVSPRTVQRHLARMEKDGLITRWRHRKEDGSYWGTTNTYYLTGLIGKCTPLARELSVQRAEKRRARQVFRTGTPIKNDSEGSDLS